MNNILYYKSLFTLYKQLGEQCLLIDNVGGTISATNCRVSRKTFWCNDNHLKYSTSKVVEQRFFSFSTRRAFNEKQHHFLSKQSRHETEKYREIQKLESFREKSEKLIASKDKRGKRRKRRKNPFLFPLLKRPINKYDLFRHNEESKTLREGKKNLMPFYLAL